MTHGSTAFVWLALFALAACVQPAPPKRIEPRMLGFQSSVRERGTIHKALSRLAPLLPAGQRLEAGWEPTLGGIPVFPVSDLKFALSWVPSPHRAVFVDSEFDAQIAARFSPPDAGALMGPIDPDALLAVVLLHELGHILGATALPKELESVAATLTSQQAVEFACDGFAADRLRVGLDAVDVDSKVNAINLQLSLISLQGNLSALRITNLGDVVPCQSGYYSDPGLAHPNFELRLLAILQATAPTPETSKMLKELAETCRRGARPSIRLFPETESNR